MKPRISKSQREGVLRHPVRDRRYIRRELREWLNVREAQRTAMREGVSIPLARINQARRWIIHWTMQLERQLGRRRWLNAP